ncbi:RNA-binding domain-containing protein [Caldivirga maquilingensis]|uniref:UPF0201 protein Cmaq_2000 n=1 Tax=Caldivirga maquilingensis (strain ATCC 700844 / DSM 13496 / JCM 10307 / IC-167) TaxID=397948 RepID=A8MC31_CALMQ|nr:RNA-binding domain-containing protein [Caldivirga maquilingensis]ABW02815.1 Protein of unknown function DUF54 [Caldivirga maquilingensis IC-167]
MLGEVEVEVYAEVKPTESEVKVKRAVLNIIELDELEVIDVNGVKYIHGKARGLSYLSRIRDLIRRERIRDTARDLLNHSVVGDEVVINVNKQAAYVGVLSFAMGEVESPLGPITIRIKSSNPQQLIMWLTSG